MRRHLSLTLSVLLVSSVAVVAAIAAAGASTGPQTIVPHTVVRIVSGSACVPAAEFCFSPAKKSIAPGTRVVWRNKTITIHTVTRCTATACNGVTGGTGTDTGFGSPGTIASGGRYSFVFHGAGTYVYYCTIHGYAVMHGTITVT
jgi:plastocyanin